MSYQAFAEMQQAYETMRQAYETASGARIWLWLSGFFAGVAATALLTIALYALGET